MYLKKIELMYWLNLSVKGNPVQIFKFFMKYMCNLIKAKTYAFVLKSLDSVFQFFSWDTKQNKCSEDVFELVHCKTTVTGLGLKICFSDREF